MDKGGFFVLFCFDEDKCGIDSGYADSSFEEGPKVGFTSYSI